MEQLTMLDDDSANSELLDHVDDVIDRLVSTVPAAAGTSFDPALLADADLAFRQGLRVIGSIAYGSTFVEAVDLARRYFDDKNESMWVTKCDDGRVSLSMNPTFITNIDQGPKGVAFGEAHEMEHLFCAHLDDAYLRKTLKELNKPNVTAERRRELQRRLKAAKHSHELYINTEVSELLDMEPVTAFAGTWQSIRPDEEYRKWAKAYDAAGLDPNAKPSREEWTRTAAVCREYLLAIPEYVDDLPEQACAHEPGPGSAGDSEEGSSDSSPDNRYFSLDELDANGEFTDEVFSTQAEKVAAGDGDAIRDMQRRANKDPDNPAWGRFGLESLLEEKTEAQFPRQFWEQQLAGELRSLFIPSTRARYNQLRGHLTAEQMRSLGSDWPDGQQQPLEQRAPDRTWNVYVFVDASASVPDRILNEKIPGILGDTDSIGLKRFTFSENVHAYQPGRGIIGRGGTNLKAVYETVDGLRVPKNYDGVPDPTLLATGTDPDVIVIVTDGDTAHQLPTRLRERYVFLILPRGSHGSYRWNQWMANAVTVKQMPADWAI